MAPAHEEAIARPLPRSFYEGPVARRRARDDRCGARAPHAEGTTAGRIVECEAYRGPEDLAAHSAGGRRTRRTEAMFGPPGRAYMFLLYGMHWAFNVVVGPEGHPHAVLVRAIEPVLGAGADGGAPRRRADEPPLTNGPGKLCAALGLDARAYGADLCGLELFLTPGETAGERRSIARGSTSTTPAPGPAKPWRFYERRQPLRLGAPAGVTATRSRLLALRGGSGDNGPQETMGFWPFGRDPANVEIVSRIITAATQNGYRVRGKLTLHFRGAAAAGRRRRGRRPLRRPGRGAAARGAGPRRRHRRRGAALAPT